MAPSKVWCVKQKPSQAGTSKSDKALAGHGKAAEPGHFKEVAHPWRTEDDRETCPGSEDGASSHSSGDESWSPGAPMAKTGRTKLSGNATPFVPAVIGTKLSISAPMFTPMSAPILFEGAMPATQPPCGVPLPPPQVYPPQAYQPQMCPPPMHVPQVTLPQIMDPSSPALCMLGLTPIAGATPNLSPLHQSQWQLPGPMPELLPVAGYSQAFTSISLGLPQWQHPELLPMPELAPMPELQQVPELLPKAGEAEVNATDASLREHTQSPSGLPVHTPGSDASKKLSWADIDDDDESFENPWGV